MRAVTARLDVSQIQTPAPLQMQAAILAELAIAAENIRHASSQRTQAIYYLLGFVGGGAALLANALASESFSSALAAKAGLRFGIFVLAVQLLAWATAMLATAAYVVVFKSNDSARFHGREIARLRDVLYGLPQDDLLASPGWVAVRPTEHDTRDPEGVFSQGPVTETLPLAILAFAGLAWACVTFGALVLCPSLTLKGAAIVLGAFYAGTLGHAAFSVVRPMRAADRAIRAYDRRVDAAALRALDRKRNGE